MASTTVKADTAGLFMLSGRFTTDVDGNVLTQDIPNVTSITVSTGSNQTIYRLNLDRSFQKCMYVDANTQGGLHICSVGQNVSSTTSPSFFVVMRNPIEAGNHVTHGGIATDPTTPSSQVTGAGNTTFNVDVSQVGAYINGTFGTVAATADFALHSGSQLVANGESCVVELVVKNVAGTFSFDAVASTPAATGSQTNPSDATITSTLGHSNWARLCRCTINRTGDTTVTQTQNTITRMLNPQIYQLYPSTTLELKTVYLIAILVE